MHPHPNGHWIDCNNLFILVHSLEEFGAHIKQPTTCCGTYITLHCILLCGNLAVHFQLGMTPCYCVRMGYLLTYAALDITNKKLTKQIQIWYPPSELKEENYFYHDDIIMTSSKFLESICRGVVCTPPNNNVTW